MSLVGRDTDGKLIWGSEFYASEEGKHFLLATENGKFMFTWEAEYDDGKTVRQLDDLAFERTLKDPDFVASQAPYLSVGKLDRHRVKAFTLHPVALTKKVRPMLASPHGVNIVLSTGELFTSYWLVDHTPATGSKLYRTVMGIEYPNGTKDLTVFSPSGRIKHCDNDNQSYEGE